MKTTRRSVTRRIAALVAAGLWLACAINPVTGERELILMSPEREASLGRQSAAQVEEQMGLVKDTGLNAYVSAIGKRLAAVSPRQDTPYTFQVVDMPEANAFALPGGYVYVSRGLLALCNSEDELANVIGHEVGHVAARHSAQRETRAAGVTLLSVLGSVLASAYGGAEAAQTVGQIGQVAGAGLIASYGRDQEREADRVGQSLAARAGWDPHGMTQFLKTLELDTRLHLGGQGRAPSFFDSHPATPERVGNTAVLANSLQRSSGSPIARTRAEFFDRIRGVRVGPNPGEGVIEGDRFSHPGLEFQIRFPGEWRIQNGKSAVGAISSDQTAQILLESQGRGSDPAAAANAYLAKQQLQVVDQGVPRIGALRAYRVIATANTQSGTLGVDMTWIVHRGSIFRITGATSSAKFQSYKPVFDRTSGSFRALTSTEAREFVEHRLEIAAARAGESIDSFSKRVGNTWDLERTAVANNLTPNDRLQSGQLLKISVARPYRP